MDEHFKREGVSKARMVNINVDGDVDSDLYIPPRVIQMLDAEKHTRFLQLRDGY